MNTYIFSPNLTTRVYIDKKNGYTGEILIKCLKCGYSITNPRHIPPCCPMCKINKKFHIQEKKMYILGITGQKRNGKDFTYNRLSKMYKVKRVSFADPLKQACKAIFPDPNINWENKDSEYLPALPRDILLRDLMKGLGLGLRKELYEDFWIDLAMITASNFWRDGFLPVITDVRFQNEAAAIKRVGGKIIRVKRTDLQQVFDPHPSEQEILQIRPDLEVINDGTEKYLSVIDCLIAPLIPERFLLTDRSWM